MQDVAEIRGLVGDVKDPNQLIGYVEVDNHEIAYGNAFKNILAFDAGRPVNVHNPAAVAEMPFEAAH